MQLIKAPAECLNRVYALHAVVDIFIIRFQMHRSVHTVEKPHDSVL